MAIMISLQSKACTSMASGAAPSTHPMLPLPTKKPEIFPYSLPLNHPANTFMPGTNTAETPRPIRILAKTDRPKLGERPNRITPIPPTEPKSVAVFLAPQESESIPTGTCMSA
jgi:hypothetical protein